MSSTMSYKAIILAAGVGNRLGTPWNEAPKALLRFGDATLLRRHLGALEAAGVDEIVIGVGYRADLIAAELEAIGARARVRTVVNPRYLEGSVVTLWTVREELAGGRPVLLMDADVLYDATLIRRLCESRHANCLLLDTDIEDGDEPVKICFRGDEIVDFGKTVTPDHDRHGESVGFFRFSPEAASQLAGIVAGYVEAGRSDEMYEEAIRDLLRALPPGAVGVADVTGVPWIEIDFPEDIARAETEVLPRLAD
jgi:choline kinase